MQGLCEWIYGLFLDLISYCANALLGVMTTDLVFWETSVPVVGTLYQIMVSVGWGLLIGNCVFQAMKAMFAGFGFETESPITLLLRSALFGTLLLFSFDICEISLSIGKNIIELIGIPSSVTLSFPNGEMFSASGASWLLVIIIGFVLGFQMIKLFFEIAERYVVVAVLTLLMPMGLAMGGSKSTKDICAGYIRTYASMVLMMILNVLFLKLILSALATMPSNAMVLPWCLLVVGIAKTARKADNLVSKIGLSPAITGDPLGHGRGAMVAMMAARTIMRSASKSNGTKSGGKGNASGKNAGASYRSYAGKSNSTTRNTAGGTHIGGSTVNSGGSTVGNNATYTNGTQNRHSSQNGSTNTSRANVGGNNAGNTHINTTGTDRTNMGGTTVGGANIGVTSSSSNMRTNASARFGSSGNVQFGTGGTKVNTNRFGANGRNVGGNSGSVKPGTMNHSRTQEGIQTVSKGGSVNGGIGNTGNGVAHGSMTGKSAQRDVSSSLGKKGNAGSTVNSATNQGGKQTKRGTKGSMVNRSAKGNSHTPVSASPKKNLFGNAGSGKSLEGGIRKNRNPLAKGKSATPTVSNQERINREPSASAQKIDTGGVSDMPQEHDKETSLDRSNGGDFDG